MLLGGRLSLSVPDSLLRFALAAVLGLSGLKLIDVPGASIAIVCVLGVGMTALLVYIGRRSWVRYQRGTGGPPSESPVATDVPTIAR